MHRTYFNQHNPADSYPEPSRFAARIAAEISFHHLDQVRALQAIIRHPRSLARPTPRWRPPVRALPAVAGAGPLSVAITRYRVGERARARVRGFGEKRTPAYLLSLRLTHPDGSALGSGLAEGWVRAIVERDAIDAVHEIAEPGAVTFLWLVDSHYAPVRSPASLFTGFSAAA